MLNRLRCLHGILYEWWVTQNRKLALSFPSSHSVYIIGSPTHTNIGDSAIILAQIHFLQNCGYKLKDIKEITIEEYSLYRADVINRIIKSKSKALYTWPGGGNFGDQWMSEENFRRQSLMELQNKECIVFPQTLYYTSSENGEKEKLKSIPYYNRAEKLTICAREEQSYRFMQKLYPDVNLLLVPDLVLSMKSEDFGVVPRNRKNVLLCFRNDAERSFKNEDRVNVELYLKNHGYNYSVTDMYSESIVTKDNRLASVKKKLEEFGGAELVITDRLHGMVFSAISNTPCIVFGNYNHKVKGTYDWISYLPYIKYAESVTQLQEYIPGLSKMKDCAFDNKPLQPYYDELRGLIVSKIGNQSSK